MATDGHTAQGPGTRKATGREWVGLAVLALPCLLYSMDLTVLNLAVPHLSADLEPSAAQFLWIVDVYGFLVAGSLIARREYRGGWRTHAPEAAKTRPEVTVEPPL